MAQNVIDLLLGEIARVTGGHMSDVSVASDGKVALIDGLDYRVDCTLAALTAMPSGPHRPPAELFGSMLRHCRTDSSGLADVPETDVPAFTPDQASPDRS